MDLELDDSQKMLRDSVRRVLAQAYRSGERRRMAASPPGRDPGIWKTLAELGLLGLGIDEHYGGTGPADVESAIVMEELGRVAALEPFAANIVMAAGTIQALGDDAQRAHWLPAIACGERTATWADGRASVQAHPAPHGWVLRGTVQAAELPIDAASDAFVVTATQHDSQEVRVYLLDRHRDGLTVESHRGFDPAPATSLRLYDVAVTEGDCLGGTAASRSIDVIDALLQRAKVATLAEAVGAMSAMVELTIGHLRIRQQFGVPLSQFQALQHRLVDMAVAVEEARSMTLLAIVALAKPDPAERAALITAAQIQIACSCRTVGQQAVQLHGGIGLTLEYDLAPLFLRTTRIETGYGGIENQLQLLIEAGGINRH